jgi:hypothetical protein
MAENQNKNTKCSSHTEQEGNANVVCKIPLIVPMGHILARLGLIVPTGHVLACLGVCPSTVFVYLIQYGLAGGPFGLWLIESQTAGYFGLATASPGMDSRVDLILDAVTWLGRKQLQHWSLRNAGLSMLEQAP